MIPIIEYGTKEGDVLVKKILERSQLDYGNVQEVVDDILKEVRAKGDKALFAFTKQFDQLTLDTSTVKATKEEIEEAYSLVPPELLKVIRQAADRIRIFHEKQKRNSWLEPEDNGEIMGQLLRPLETVGVYVPGGKAAYPSSVLMNVIPAKVAGVKNIIMVSPAQKNGKCYPTTLVAAVEAGVTDIYKVGGAQAIAALAYGTETIPKVDKICGPGNIYVALAKRTVYGHVSIDSVAGPSEILVVADETANPAYVAADMLSQAEHDELASAILLTNSYTLAVEVQASIEKQKDTLERKEIIDKSLEQYGAIIVTDSIDTACSIADHIAPEHMEVCTAAPFELLPKIHNAGAIFLGNYTPEPLGDYMAGPNHILPTGGTARFFSPLNVDDFVKKSSVLSFSKESFLALGDSVVTFAEAEGLTAHANAVKIRQNEK